MADPDHRYRPIFHLSGSECSVFKIYPEEASDGNLRAYVELGGGFVLERDEDDPCVITVLDYDWYVNVKKVEIPKEFPPGKDYFKPSFLLDSWTAGKPVDLNKYRVGTSVFTRYDANDVLKRKVTWSQLTLKPGQVGVNPTVETSRRKLFNEREKRLPSDKPSAEPSARSERRLNVPGHTESDDNASEAISDDSSCRAGTGAVGASTGIKLVAWNPPSGRRSVSPLGSRRGFPYTKEEGQAMLDFISEHNYHASTGGVKMWKQMEDRKVCQNRSWQSMKEHFRKHVLPNIKEYNCSERSLKKFQLGEAERLRGRRREAQLHDSDGSSSH